MAGNQATPGSSNGFDDMAQHGLDGGSAPLGQYSMSIRDGGSAPLAAFAATNQPGTPASSVPLPMAEPLDDQEEGRIPIRLDARYPGQAWDPVLRAQLLLADFAAQPWQAIDVPEPSGDPDDITQQITVLIVLRALRAERIGEIVEQARDFTQYFANVLMINPKSYPNCWTLMAAAQAIGHMIGMHFKDKYNFPRPIQVYPALMTAIPVPPHPSYPNVHALQSRLIALCFAKVSDGLSYPLHLLADRIAENRAVAGLHYVSDKIGSDAIATGAHAILCGMKSYNDLVDKAKDEFTGLTVIHRYPARLYKPLLQDQNGQPEAAGSAVVGTTDCLPKELFLNFCYPWPARDQQARVTCVAFCVTACAEYQLNPPSVLTPGQPKPTKLPLRLSEEFLHWGSWDVSSTATEENGIVRLADARDALAKYGIATEGLCEYQPNIDPAAPGPDPSFNAKKDALTRLIRGGEYHDLRKHNGGLAKDRVAEKIRQLLVDDKKPVAVCVSVFHEPNMIVTGWNNQEAMLYGEVTDPSPLAVKSGSHCICIVGWQRDVAKPGKRSELSGGYFVFRNS
jgi:hypothetical protein